MLSEKTGSMKKYLFIFWQHGSMGQNFGDHDPFPTRAEILMRIRSREPVRTDVSSVELVSRERAERT